MSSCMIKPCYTPYIKIVFPHLISTSRKTIIPRLLVQPFSKLISFPSLNMNRYILFFTFVLFLQGALAELVCEELPIDMCSFAISSSGKRCLLETFESGDGNLEFQCKTSEVIPTSMQEYIENDECVSACGVDRKSIGISSDSLLETHFTLKLCSPKCYYQCPNIVDLYHNLALAEGNFPVGVFLPELCKFQQTSFRRSVIQVQSASSAASGPVSGAGGSTSNTACAPISSTTLSSADFAPAPM